jgi:hypothetical protein
MCDMLGDGQIGLREMAQKMVLKVAKPNPHIRNQPRYPGQVNKASRLIKQAVFDNADNPEMAMDQFVAAMELDTRVRPLRGSSQVCQLQRQARDKVSEKQALARADKRKAEEQRKALRTEELKRQEQNRNAREREREAEEKKPQPAGITIAFVPAKTAPPSAVCPPVAPAPPPERIENDHESADADVEAVDRGHDSDKESDDDDDDDGADAQGDGASRASPDLSQLPQASRGKAKGGPRFKAVAARNANPWHGSKHFAEHKASAPLRPAIVPAAPQWPARRLQRQSNAVNNARPPAPPQSPHALNDAPPQAPPQSPPPPEALPQSPPGLNNAAPTETEAGASAAVSAEGADATRGVAETGAVTAAAEAVTQSVMRESMMRALPPPGFAVAGAPERRGGKHQPRAHAADSPAPPPPLHATSPSHAMASAAEIPAKASDPGKASMAMAGLGAYEVVANAMAAAEREQNLMRDASAAKESNARLRGEVESLREQLHVMLYMREVSSSAAAAVIGPPSPQIEGTANKGQPPGGAAVQTAAEALKLQTDVKADVNADWACAVTDLARRHPQLAIGAAQLLPMLQRLVQHYAEERSILSVSHSG